MAAGRIAEEVVFIDQFLNEQRACRGDWRDFSEEEEIGVRAGGEEKKGEHVASATAGAAAIGKRQGVLSPLLHFRRLDSFAMLFEYITSCAGVALVDGQLVFAANRITKEQSKVMKDVTFTRAELNRVVQESMRYFSQLAREYSASKSKGTLSPTLLAERARIFRQLCSHARILSIKKEGDLRINIKSRDVVAMTEAILAGANPTIRELLHSYGYGEDKSLIYFKVFGLYRNFENIEDFIKTTARHLSTTASPPPQDMALFNAILNNSLICLPEPAEMIISVGRGSRSVSVHAELQLAGYISAYASAKGIDAAASASATGVGGARRAFYLGLSKLCCHDCNAMLYAINIEMSHNNDLVFCNRGWNNIHQPWGAPYDYWGNGFSIPTPTAAAAPAAAAAGTSTSTTSARASSRTLTCPLVSLEVQKRIDAAYTRKLREIYPQTEVDMTGRLSESEVSSISGFETIKGQQLAKLGLIREEVLSSPCFALCGIDAGKVLACVEFAEFLFSDGSGLSVYYSNYVDKSGGVDEYESLSAPAPAPAAAVASPAITSSGAAGSHDEKVLDLMNILKACESNTSLRRLLSSNGFYNASNGALSREFVERIFQDKEFVGREIARHFSANQYVFNGLGAIVVGSMQPVAAGLSQSAAGLAAADVAEGAGPLLPSYKLVQGQAAAKRVEGQPAAEQPKSGTPLSPKSPH